MFSRGLMPSKVARRRGAGWVMFVLVILPMLLAGVVLAADVTSMWTARRQASYVAQSSADGGAHQYANGTIDTVMAHHVACETFDRAIASGAMDLAEGTDGGDLACTDDVDVNAQPTHVEVTVNFRPARLLFLGWFINDDTGNSTTEASYLCDPSLGADNPAGFFTGGACTVSRSN